MKEYIEKLLKEQKRLCAVQYWNDKNSCSEEMIERRIKYAAPSPSIDLSGVTKEEIKQAAWDELKLHSYDENGPSFTQIFIAGAEWMEKKLSPVAPEPVYTETQINKAIELAFVAGQKNPQSPSFPINAVKTIINNPDIVAPPEPVEEKKDEMGS